MLNKLFGFDSSKFSLRTEILAGITTFITMSYILAVNPSIFAMLEGMPTGAVFTATALAAIIGTLVMALLAKLPFGLAPGMGLNAFFVYTVCLGMGYSWQFALTAVLIEGILFIIITLTNIREAIVHAIPESLRYAISGGIGLFIAFIGLQNANIIVANPSTIVALGEITSAGALLTIGGLILTACLVVKRVPGALLLGMIITAVAGIPLGITNFNGIIDLPHSVAPIFCKFDWSGIFSIDMVIVIFTMLFIDMFDTIGTLVGVCTKAKMLTPEGKIPKAKQAFMADAIATTAGACLGTNTTTTYVESAAGVAQGGKTGLTAFVIACCFILSLFFSPFFLAIPAAATAPVLIFVGLFMFESVKNIKMEDYTESLPAFLCVIFMPLAYSISEGIMMGMISYVVINLLTGNHKRLSVMMYILAVMFLMKYIFL
ncbi:MAG: NCS2 family permease [Rikenellaceae bacterium]|nr:NCS2 family permease [Rikenellaceae bacterium]